MLGLTYFVAVLQQNLVTPYWSLNVDYERNPCFIVINMFRVITRITCKVLNELKWDDLTPEHESRIARHVYPTTMITYPCWGACNNIQGLDGTAMHLLVRQSARDPERWLRGKDEHVVCLESLSLSIYHGDDAVVREKTPNNPPRLNHFIRSLYIPPFFLLIQRNRRPHSHMYEDDRKILHLPIICTDNKFYKVFFPPLTLSLSILLNFLPFFYMWHDQGKWVACRRFSIFRFLHHFLATQKCYTLMQTPLESDI